MSKTNAPAPAVDGTLTVDTNAPKSDAAMQQLQELKEIVGNESPAHPDMPAIGESVFLSAVYGRMVHPFKPTEDQELNTGSASKVVFDEWHQVQWKAGKLCRA